MRLIEANQGRTVIELGEAEWAFFQDLLHQYPLVPNDKRELTRKGEGDEFDADTDLLRTNLEDLTGSNRKRLQKWLNNPDTFSQGTDHGQLTVQALDRDWLLQILNDLRVGSWQQLGCPNTTAINELELETSNFRALWCMELVGLLQSYLLRGN